ncbi:MAG: hypothetical protein ACP5QN_01385 [Minisyncoccia bacterium]
MILGQKNIDHNGSGVKEKILWIQGWVKNPIPEIKEVLNDEEVIISHHYRYIFGFTGKETEIKVKIISMNIIEVKETKKEEN